MIYYRLIYIPLVHPDARREMIVILSHWDGEVVSLNICKRVDIFHYNVYLFTNGNFKYGIQTLLGFGRPKVFFLVGLGRIRRV